LHALTVTQEGLKEHCVELLLNCETLKGVDWQQSKSKQTFESLKRELE